jgi:hypothetical protein
MAKWLGDGFYMFQEIFDWTDERDEQSHAIKVEPGNIITAQVSFQKGGGAFGDRTYIMNMWVPF